MNSDINKVILTGAVVGPIQEKQTTKGTRFLEFSIRCEEHNKFGSFNAVIPVTIWGEQAQTILRFIKEENIIAVEGSLSSSASTNALGTKNFINLKVWKFKKLADGIRPTKKIPIFDDSVPF